MESENQTVKNPELSIGLVGPIGVDLTSVSDALEVSLKLLQYRVEHVHVTSVMQDFLPDLRINEKSYSSRYLSLIKESDNVRRLLNNNAALACLAISEIRRLRGVDPANAALPENKRSDSPVWGTAYVMRQFKRQEEIALLRQVYGWKFIQVSVYSDRDDRKRYLEEKIKDYGTGIVQDAEAEAQALNLIDVDNNEINDDYGQRVSDVFHLGDVFVAGRNKNEISSTIGRFIRALFGDNGISPTKREYGMYAAAGAALRSLDLSRQVGCAIFSEQGEVITMGCNEVPKAFGGTYWSDDATEKHRDFEEGRDGNHRRKVRLVHDLVERLGGLGFLSDKLLNKGDAGTQVQHLMKQTSITDSKIMDIIEFGRIIHAEMSAITDAARLGKALGGAVLFCTTFPCHMCAKHIVSAGIKHVIFLEPYPKSHAKDLRSDSITFSSSEAEAKALFEPFLGISPRRYRDIFEKGKRKNKAGEALTWYQGEPVPSIEDRGGSYVENEAFAISLVTQGIVALAESQKAGHSRNGASWLT